MSASQLKIIACIFMLIDHIGIVFFPKIIIMRVIGRLAFPLFAYFVAEGYKQTKDITDYIGRLFLFALISQLPFQYAFNSKEPYLNIFFTLASGLYVLYAYNKYNNLYIVVFISLVCQLVNSDYGFYGILLIFFFHKYKDNFNILVRNIIFLTYTSQIIQFIIQSLNQPFSIIFSNMIFYLIIQPLCLFSLILIKQYNGKKGLNIKYIFYIFYPFHLIIIGFIKNLFDYYFF